jgi:hypothetical protein
LARKRKDDPWAALTVSEPISVKLQDGTAVTGTLWMHPSRKGRFEVEYKGVRKSDERSDYRGEEHIRMIAVVLLKELAEEWYNP